MLVIVARVPILPGNRNQAIQLAAAMVDVACHEAETTAYAAHVEESEADAIWFYEAYVSASGLESHSRNQRMRELQAKLAPLTDGGPTVWQLKGIASTGMQEPGPLST